MSRRILQECNPPHAAPISNVGLVLILATVAYQRFTWLPAVSAWHGGFFWQRCGFAVITNIDVPILQILASGILVASRPVRQLQ